MDSKTESKLGHLGAQWIAEIIGDVKKRRDDMQKHLARLKNEGNYKQAHVDALALLNAMLSAAAPQVVADERALPPPFFYYESNEDGSVEWNEGCVCKDDVYTNAEYAKENGTHGGKVYSEAQMRAALQAAPVQPVAAAPAEEFGFKAVRLRRTAFLLGLEGAIPDNDKDLMDCMGAVLGMICREVERLAAPAAQGDAKATMKQVCASCAGEGRFYKTVMTSFGGGEREETVCKVCVGSGVIYSAIAAKAAS